MAGMTSGSRLPEPEEFDYSVSHREVPIPSVGYSSTRERRPPQFGEDPGQPREKAGSAAAAGTRATGDSIEAKRRGSFSERLLHRNTSKSHGEAPPLPPTTRIAEVYAHANAKSRSQASNSNNYPAPAVSGHTHNRGILASSYRNDAEGGNSNSSKMLRKLSSGRHEEERAAREAAILQQRQHYQTPRQPPRLPSINDFNDEVRPDSLAIFNNQYGSHTPSAPQATTANFPHPGNAAMPSSGYGTYSSSPAYALRPGNAFAQQAASSSPAGAGKISNGEAAAAGSVDRSESMAHRGRYSYASSTAPVAHVNSPRRVRRRKDPTPFNILVVGAKNSGKTSFISFLRHSFALPPNKQPYSTHAAGDSHVNGSKSSFTSHYLETEMDGERVGLTLWDSAGLQKHIIDLQLREMAAFVESKFEETFLEEQKVNRSPGVKDTHIHCVFFVLDPVKLDSTIAALSAPQKANAEGLDDEMGLQVIRALWGKTTVIPIVSKADTLTVGHMAYLKRAVWGSLKGAKLDPLEALELDDDEEELDEDTLAEEDEGEEEKDGVVNNLEADSNSDYDSASDFSQGPKTKRNGHNRQSSLTGTAASSASRGDDTPYIPMSILSPDLYDLPPYTKPSKSSKVGRRFPWGFADPYDAEHCDFVRLRDSIFSEWRGDLRDLARTKWYENWRTSRLKNLPGQGRARVKGGITPVAAVPKEGRTSPRETRTLSGGNGGGAAGAGAAGASSVPRSVSGSTAATGGGGAGMVNEQRSTSKAERMMGISASDAQSIPSSRGGTYRGVDTYQ